MEFTESQRKAIEYENGNLLISAAAGSGKTAVLTEKIARLIAEKECTVDELLVVTFTKAAASEMKSRIKKKLTEKKNEISYRNNAYRKYIEEQIRGLNSADISTMDSFLYKNIRRYFPQINISPDTRIASESEIEELEKNAMERAIKRQFGSENTEKYAKWLKLCDIISKTKDTSHLCEELLELAKEIENCGLDVEVFDERNEMNSAESTETVMMSVYRTVQEYTKGIAHHYTKLLREIESDIELEDEVYEKYQKNIISDLEICESLSNCSELEFDEAKRAISMMSLSRLGRLAPDKVTQTASVYKEVREQLRKSIDELKKEIYIGTWLDIHDEEVETAEISSALSDVLGEYFSVLHNEKVRKCLMSYSDLESFSKQVLESDTISQEISEKYKYVFIDEFQDTNETQDFIFRQVSKNASRFLVGDIKQSIYKFRGADPSVFNNYRKTWSEYDENNAENGNYTLFMSDNFRCSKEIICFTNLVTGKLFAESDIEYKESDELIYGQAESEIKEPVEVIVLKKGNVAEAEYVSERIAGIIGEYSLQLKRNVSPSDVAILMRSPSTHGEEFKAALEKRGIKSKLRKSQPLENSQVVKLIICLLEVIKNPLDDVYLAGALLSKMFGFEIRDITEIKQLTGEEQLFVSLRAYTENANRDELITEKINSYTAWMNEEKQKSISTLPSVYVENYVTENRTVLLDCVDEKSEEIEALNRFTELIAEYSANGSNESLDELLDYLNLEIVKDRNSVDENDASEAVRIMSVHSSKGLEFPVCFLCETDRKRSVRDEGKPFLLDKELGLGAKISDSTGLGEKSTLKRDMIAKRKARESSFEEIRMLYVALTRAKNKLIITGTVADPAKRRLEAMANAENIDAVTLETTDNYLDWILMCTANERSENFSIQEVLETECSVEENIVEGESVVNNEAENAENKIIERISGLCEINKKVTKLNTPLKAMAGEVSTEFLDEKEENPHESTDDADEKVLEMPKFITGANTYTAADKGTAMHTFMQFMNIVNLRDNGIDAEITRMIERKIISLKMAQLIDRKQILIFMHSKLYKLLLEAEYVKREFRFNVNLPAFEFTNDNEKKEILKRDGSIITVQGVIDCIFREKVSGQLVLIDYKTDGFSAEEYKNRKLAYEKLRLAHQDQLSTYKRICEEIYNEEVAKTCIYSTVLGELVEI